MKIRDFSFIVYGIIIPLVLSAGSAYGADALDSRDLKVVSKVTGFIENAGNPWDEFFEPNGFVIKIVNKDNLPLYSYTCLTSMIHDCSESVMDKAMSSLQYKLSLAQSNNQRITINDGSFTGWDGVIKVTRASNSTVVENPSPVSGSRVAEGPGAKMVDIGGSPKIGAQRSSDTAAAR